MNWFSHNFEYSKLNNVLVTGANGFIGISLCRRLIIDGFNVCGVVRRGKAGSLPKKVYAKEIDSVGNQTDWSLALRKVEVVVHLAARVHQMKNPIMNPFAAFQEINVHGTEHLAESALQAGVKRFIFMSSVKVNGDENRRAYNDFDKPHPIDPYGISKLQAEQCLQEISTGSGMETTILRPPLVYGPGVKANFLELIKLVKRQHPLPLASVHNRRSFIYLENLVDAIVTCIQNPTSAGKTYLVSDGQDVSTPALIRMLADALGVKAKLFPCPSLLLFIAGRLCGKGPAVDRLIGTLTVDSVRIRHELNWKPLFTLKEGLQKTALWYESTKKSR